MLLCAVLVMCLFGAVYIISQRYVHEVISELETQSKDVAGQVEVLLQANPEEDLSSLEGRFEDLEVEFDDLGEAFMPSHFTLEPRPDGGLDKVARQTVTFGDRRILLTVRVALLPGAEIVRAFTTPYMMLLTAVFLVALGLMVFFIARMLRPLSELSESCARISLGELKDVAIRDKSGEVRALEETFNRMVGSLRDKEVMEANLRQAQRLSALGNLAAGVAHDVRNPLNAIKLLSSHALDSVEDDRAAGQLRTIRKEVDRLDEIVTGFLSLARERELQPEPCRIDALLDECVHMLAQDAEAREVRLTADLRAGDTELNLDSKQFTRAVLNVLLNAMEACPQGGRVRLFSRLTDVTCEVEVRDDGQGIPKDVTERAFEPYYTTKATGTGLGLSITRGIIEEHGGTIALTSSEGHGTQALITLPLRNASDA